MSRRITLIGGGTGSYNLLRGLKRYPDLAITSIVTMMDSGGDSGRLRDEFGVLPPGDLRRCLVALSEESELMRELFQFRFVEEPLAGRNFGNLIFLALTKILGTEKQAVDEIGRILQIRGQVLPITWDSAHLCAELSDGRTISGEANIDVPKHDATVPIRRVYLDPKPRANPDALRAILDADFIVLAPGDLYTSTIPNLLVEGVPEAIRKSRAGLVYVLNLMTKSGETTGYTASEHVAQIVQYCGRVADAILTHREAPLPEELLRRYGAEAAHRVIVDEDALLAMGVRLIRAADIMSVTSLVRHHPQRTAAAIVRLFDDLGAQGARSSVPSKA